MVRKSFLFSYVRLCLTSEVDLAHDEAFVGRVAHERRRRHLLQAEVRALSLVLVVELLRDPEPLADEVLVLEAGAAYVGRVDERAEDLLLTG